MNILKLPSGRFVNIDHISITSNIGNKPGVPELFQVMFNSDVHDGEFVTFRGDDARFLAGMLDKIAEMTMVNLAIGNVRESEASE
jgi:hypothetical protein